MSRLVSTRSGKRGNLEEEKWAAMKNIAAEITLGSLMTRMTKFLAVVLFVLAGWNAIAQDVGKPDALARSEVTRTIADARKIVTGRGTEDSRAVSINGIQQWISVRGKDRRNPILLLLHGGPGSPEMPYDWTFQTPWEDFFTVVEWDQRGAGKTYALNDAAKIAPTMTMSQMLSDTEQVIEYLRRTYGKQKIFLLGHSWGSVLGVMTAQKHPEWLYAYVGVGQWVNTQKSEREGYAFALSQAKEHNNAEAMKDLQALAPYPGDGAAFTVERLTAQRKWLSYYGGLAWGRRDFRCDVEAWDLSPDYTEKELVAVDAGTGYSISHLLPTLMVIDFDKTTTFRCPVFVFVGQHDYATSHTLAEAWFHEVKAPQKELFRFEDAAHMLMQEQPGRFLQHLVDDVRPIAVKAGDAAPDESVQK
jgi:pimeloyl-ACP methyl ester carboxylesterase